MRVQIRTLREQTPDLHLGKHAALVTNVMVICSEVVPASEQMARSVHSSPLPRRCVGNDGDGALYM